MALGMVVGVGRDVPPLAWAWLFAWDAPDAVDEVVVERPEDLESVTVEVVAPRGWPAEGERLLPMKASAPNRARTTTATITAVPRRGRRFMEWRACRWARSVRDICAPREEGS
jgi:hypothetical protein